MSVPKFYEFFKSFLNAIKDGEIHKSKEVQAFIAKEMNLGDERIRQIRKGAIKKLERRCGKTLKTLL